ncbi:MAG: trypsin-like peptidase domain-containing protein [Lachnospiraceae bacterium]|nr:trypsin-like peptidase domain-containing protein [Lachnospiraceae bacterium]
MYGDYDNEKKRDNTENTDTGYKNVGSSGTNSANEYDSGYNSERRNGYGYGSGTNTGNYNYGNGENRNNSYNYGSGSGQSRPHYTSYQDANYREPVGNNKNSNSGNKKKAEAGNKGKHNGFWKKAVAAVVAGILFGGSAAGAFYGVYKVTGLDNAVATISTAEETAASVSRATNTAVKEQAQVKTTVAQTADTDISGVAQVVEDVMPSVVAITNAVTVKGQTWWGETVEQTGESAGSGIIVGENDDELLVATNQHVISDATKLSVQFANGSSAEANLKGQDEEADIAVIAVAKKSLSGNTIDEIKIATLGDSDELKVGEQVVAIGNAMGYGQTTTTGIISALGIESQFKSVSHALIQTDAAINPGNSGGALLNMKGELIGINEAKAGQVLSNGTIVEGMGYAIPISYARPIIDELMNKTTKTKAADDNQAYLGISGVDVTTDVSKTYDIPEGIYVAQVDSGLAADKAGIERGDVIIKFDDQTVGSMEDLKELMQYYEAGTKVNITIKKQADGGYTEKSIEVTLGKRPTEQTQ